MFASHLGTAVPKTEDTALPERFFYSATEDKAKGQLILKLVNAASVPRSINLAIDGGTAGGELTVTTLHAPDPLATNTILHPRTVVPENSIPVHVAAKFTQTVPAYTIQVLTIALK
jgi:alpha-L-arabinofuranosidase